MDARQQGGFTPLHGAAQNGQVEVVEMLLAHGAEPSALSVDGKSAYQIDLDAGQGQVAGLLEIPWFFRLCRTGG